MASGAGTKQNLPQAWAWANIAIQNGDKDAKTLLGEISTIATAKDVEDGKKALEELRKEFAKSADPAAAGAKPADDKDPTVDAPKEDAPKEDAPKEDAPKEDAPKEDAPKEDAPKEDAPKEDAPKEAKAADDKK
jgi:hypothetical protein